MARLAHDYANVLGAPGLDIVPDQWPHLTVQGMGFVDEVDSDEVQHIVAAAHVRLRTLGSFQLSLGPARVSPEGVWLEAAPQTAAARGGPSRRRSLPSHRPRRG